MISAGCLAPPETRATPARHDLDTHLMLRAQAGDGEAFGRLLERNYERVVNIAFRFDPDPGQAEEVAQEAFLRVFQARARYRPDCRFTTYLHRVATNLCLSRVRRRRVRRNHSSLHEVSVGDPPYEALLREELRERVQSAVAGLPERQRLAIVLQRFEGLGYAEVGAALGLSVPATKSLLHRARRSLRAALEEYVPERLEGTSCSSGA